MFAAIYFFCYSNYIRKTYVRLLLDFTPLTFLLLHKIQGLSRNIVYYKIMSLLSCIFYYTMKARQMGAQVDKIAWTEARKLPERRYDCGVLNAAGACPAAAGAAA